MLTIQKTSSDYVSEEKIKEAYYEELVDNNPYEQTREQYEFWSELLEEIEYWKTIPLKEAELDVLYAIEYLMKNICGTSM